MMRSYDDREEDEAQIELQAQRRRQPREGERAINRDGGGASS